MASSWREANKFRLVTIMVSSFTLSLVGINAVGVWTLPSLVTVALNAILAGAAFLQCPGDRVPVSKP